MRPFFSIIIPALNEEKYLPSLLNDLLVQRETDFEVIIVDGKSTDRTMMIVKRLRNIFKEKKRLLRLYTSDRQNAAFQRNLGVEKTRGKYLLFFDADLKITPDYLKKLKIKLKKDKALFVTTFVKTDKQNLLPKLTVVITNLISDKAWLLGKQIGYGFNLVIEKNAFIKIGGFDPKVNVTDDYDFCLRAKAKGYRLKIYKDLFVELSLRRFQTMGWSKAFNFYFKVISYNLLKGPPKEEVFIYPMGGKAHK